MHYKRKKPRTKSRSVPTFPNGASAHWNIMFHSRPRRRRERLGVKRLCCGEDPDALVWDLGSRRPHVYYW